ncbi:MAG: hypothetical protein KF777_01950 [Planctomycetaceae bacterium]|nr:hypothetical protein [Planctomycetaceae bacterium]
MRLTLRTLLAYLDDTLEPEMAREIGKKVQESPMAAAQIARVREVVRRRRLQAPDLTGSGMGLDPNVVAEYLDNTLAPDEVVDVERVCLESDLQLAEVAAVHQVLTIALGDPTPVPADARERLYALGPVRSGDRLEATTPAAAPTPSGPVAAAAADWDQTFRDGLPDELKVKPSAGRFWPVAAIVLLLGVWIGLVAFDKDFVSTLQETQTNRVADAPPNKIPSGEEAIVATADPGSGNSEAKPAPAPTGQQEPKDSAVVATTQVPAIPPGLDPAPPQDASVKTQDKVATASPIEPKMTGKETPVPATPAESPAVVAAPVVPAVPPNGEPVATTVPQSPSLTVSLVHDSGPILRLRRGDPDWYAETGDAQFGPAEELASSAPFESILDVDDGALRIVLMEDSAVRLLEPSEAGAFGVWPRRGRVLLKAMNAEKLPVACAVRSGESLARLELLTAETSLAIEVGFQEPTGLESVPKVYPPLSIYLAGGSIRWATPDGKSQQVDAPAYFRWDVSRDLAAGSGSLSEIMPLTTTPEWLNPQSRRLSSNLKPYATQFRALFEPDIPLMQSIAPLMKDPRPVISEMATHCLVATQDFPGLVQALAEAPHPEARATARRGIREWLVQHPADGAVLRRELGRFYRPADLETVYRLLWGYSDMEMLDRGPSDELVNSLRNPLVEVRELAIAELERHTGKRYDFRPQGSAQQREAAVQRWVNHLDRVGAARSMDGTSSGQ